MLYSIGSVAHFNMCFFYFLLRFWVKLFSFLILITYFVWQEEEVSKYTPTYIRCHLQAPTILFWEKQDLIVFYGNFVQKYILYGGEKIIVGPQEDSVFHVV